MVKESKYCSRVIKNHFNSELFMIKEDDKNFEGCKNTFDENNVEEIIAMPLENIRSVAHKYCNINVSLNYKDPIVFHNLKIYAHLVMQELGKFNFEINVIPNGLEI